MKYLQSEWGGEGVSIFRVMTPFMRSSDGSKVVETAGSDGGGRFGGREKIGRFGAKSAARRYSRMSVTLYGALRRNLDTRVRFYGFKCEEGRILQRSRERRQQARVGNGDCVVSNKTPGRVYKCARARATEPARRMCKLNVQFRRRSMRKSRKKEHYSRPRVYRLLD